MGIDLKRYFRFCGGSFLAWDDLKARGIYLYRWFKRKLLTPLFQKQTCVVHQIRN